MPMINGRPIGNAFRLCSIISCFSITWCFSTTALSQDQRRRLALLQAWLEAKPIYLFDEWGSDQDPEFNAVLYQEILPAFNAKGKTLIAITHDDRYFHIADRIIKLESGCIDE